MLESGVQKKHDVSAGSKTTNVFIVFLASLSLSVDNWWWLNGLVIIPHLVLFVVIFFFLRQCLLLHAARDEVLVLSLGCLNQTFHQATCIVGRCWSSSWSWFFFKKKFFSQNTKYVQISKFCGIYSSNWCPILISVFEKIHLTSQHWRYTS